MDMTCEHRPILVAGPEETEYKSKSVQNLPSVDISAQAQAQYFVEEFFEQLGMADFGFQAFLSWLRHKVQDSGRGFGNEELQQTQGVWHQVGLASEAGEVRQDQLQTVIGLLLEKGMLVRGKSARWLQKENKALLQENARLKSLLGLSGDDSLASMVERLRDKLSLARAELEDQRQLVLELEVASHSEHQARLDNSLSEAAQFSGSSHAHGSLVHEQMSMTSAGSSGSVSLNATVAALQDCLEAETFDNVIVGTEDNTDRAELREFPSGLVESLTSDSATSAVDQRCDAHDAHRQLSKARRELSLVADHSRTMLRDSDSELKHELLHGATYVKVESCIDRNVNTSQIFNRSLAPTCESGTTPAHFESSDTTQKYEEHNKLDRADVGVQATSESDCCPRHSSVQAGSSFADQVDAAVQSVCIEKDMAIDFDVATWSPWLASQGADSVRGGRSFMSKQSSGQSSASLGYSDEDQPPQKSEARSQDVVLCTNCGELVDLTEDDAKVKRSVQEMLLDLEREKNVEIERLRKLLAARTFELDKFEQSKSQGLQEGQKVRALVKMKWKKDGKQMAVTRHGSIFKVNIGALGIICSLDPLCVSWPTAKHGPFIGEVACDQVELESSGSHESWSSETRSAGPGLLQGSIVSVQDLNEGHLLNGQKGVCEQWDATAGRWQVRLDIGKVIAVRPTNIRPIA